MKLHIFNPEHDLALAAHLRQFTAPHAGRQLRSDLAFIPALWADQGDLVLVDDIDNARDKVRHFGEHLLEKVEFITKLQLEHLLKTEFIDCVHPWGWDLSLKGELERIGLPGIMLPTDEVLDKVRAISSRQWAAEHLQQDVVYADNFALVKECVTKWDKAVVKAPWSSSGRGVKYVSADEFRTNGEYPAFQRWVSNIIFRQGGVTVEPYYNKVKDFGMEFEAIDGQIVYRGLSLFQVAKNAYTGNVLASEEEKEEMLQSYVSHEQLEAISQHVCEVMQPALKGVYSGPFGVDMMVCAKEPGSKDVFINPCIELNLRRTMGHVALALSGHGEHPLRMMQVLFDGNRYHLTVRKIEQNTKQNV